MHGLLQVGGISLLSLFVCLFAVVGAFGTSVAYAWRPTERKLALMRPLSLANIFAALTAFLIGIGNELAYIASRSSDAVTRNSVLMGVAEAFVPLFVTFGFLAVAWVLIAVGQQRQES
jgi:hypothetical protein